MAKRGVTEEMIGREKRWRAMRPSSPASSGGATKAHERMQIKVISGGFRKKDDARGGGVPGVPKLLN